MSLLSMHLSHLLQQNDAVRLVEDHASMPKTSATFAARPKISKKRPLQETIVPPTCRWSSCEASKPLFLSSRKLGSAMDNGGGMSLAQAYASTSALPIKARTDTGPRLPQRRFDSPVKKSRDGAKHTLGSHLARDTISILTEALEVTDLRV